MIQIIKADGAAELALIDNLRTRAAEIGEEINRTAAQMMADVKERGYEAVREYSVKLDGAEPKEFTKEELQAAYDACDPKLISGTTTSTCCARRWSGPTRTAVRWDASSAA